MATNILRHWLLLFLLTAAMPAPAAPPAVEFIEAPYELTVLKQTKASKKRFREITTTGRFLVCRIELRNQDTVEHRVDYPCFCVTDSDGIEYEVHVDATFAKQDERTDLSILKDSDSWGFDKMIVKPKFRQNGWLIFEVPAPGNYQVKFRGYLQ